MYAQHRPQTILILFAAQTPSFSNNVHGQQYNNRRRSATSHSTPNSPTKARSATRASTEALCTCMTADPTLLGSKFAPYGKDGCMKGKVFKETK